jgi:dihydrofolate synthase/folylpolyglutamate synthase
VSEASADFRSSVAYLDDLYRTAHLPAAQVGLTRAATLLRGLGDPHRTFRSVHVAGSTGKGSTTSMIGAVLQCAGYRTGIFRSPHLESYTERITVDGRDITEAEWAGTFNQVRPVVDAMRENRMPGYDLGRPTLFEVLFAMACLYFAERGVEWAAVETGLGGRLDATNLLQSDVAAVTNISLEHTHILGATVEAIAREKAAIIKQGANAVTAAEGRALDVIRQRAEEVGAPLLVVGEDIRVQHGASGGAVVLRYGSDDLRVMLPLAGAHQALNAAVAFGAIESLRSRGVSLPVGTVREALETVRIPGRLERFEGTQDVILDGAHSPAAAEALAAALRDLPPARTVLVFAAMEDKDVDAMAAPLAPLVDRVVVTRVPGTGRTASLERLRGAFTRLGRQVLEAESASEALELARSLAPSGGRIVIAGSMYLVGALRPAFAGVPV